MTNLQFPKPAFIYLLYTFVRAYFIAKKQGRNIYARALLTPIIGFTFINLYMIFMFPKITFWLLVLIIGLASIYYVKGEYDVRKGKLPPDKEATNQRKLVLEFLIVLVLSFIIVKILGFDYFTAGF